MRGLKTAGLFLLIIWLLITNLLPALDVRSSQSPSLAVASCWRWSALSAHCSQCGNENHTTIA
jgi:hypothetical protein